MVNNHHYYFKKGEDMSYEKYLAKSKLKSVYVENNKAIKVFDKNYNKSDVLYEALNTARVEDAGVNIPKLLEVAVTDGKWSITSEYVEGPTLTQLIEKYLTRLMIILRKWLNTRYLSRRSLTHFFWY